MFSPEASLQSARSSLRGNRRRQRDSNGLDQPRRKRSKLGEDGASQITAGSDSKTNGSAHVNGYAAGPESADSSLVLVDMPVREKKSAPKRVVKEDSTQYLVRSSMKMASLRATS
jgi:nuclear pore complex protein Nup133